MRNVECSGDVEPERTTSDQIKPKSGWIDAARGHTENGERPEAAEGTECQGLVIGLG